MIETNRRAFLFGMGAAVAAAAVLRPEALLMPSPGAFKVRRIAEITFGPTGESHGAATFELWLRGEKQLHFAVGPGGSLFWRAYAGEELLQRDCDVLRIEMQGGVGGIAVANLIVRDELESGEHVLRLEKHEQGQPPVLINAEA